MNFREDKMHPRRALALWAFLAVAGWLAVVGALRVGSVILTWIGGQ